MNYIKLFEYFDFIVESNVEYSQKFQKVLDTIKSTDESGVANLVYDLLNTDQSIQSNYFDIPEYDPKLSDMITFITSRKAKEISSNITGKWILNDPTRTLGISPENAQYYEKLDMELPKAIIPPAVGSLGKIEKEWESPNSGKTWVKFVPDDSNYDPIMINKEGLSPDGLSEDSYYNMFRQSTKIGRAVRSLLSSSGIKVTDKQIELFVNHWKSAIDKMNDVFSNFEEVTGDKISYWYNKSRYELPDSGVLGNSCMRDVDSDFFDIYVNNPDVISLLIYKNDEGKIKGRALVWKIEDKKFVDRIYTNYDSDVNLFKQYSKSRGWYYKYYNDNSAQMNSIGPNGQFNFGSPKIKLKNFSYEYYPYMDTMKYYNPNTGIISNDEFKSCVILESTDGIADPARAMIWVDYYEEEMEEDLLIWCDYGSGYRLDGDCFYSRYYGSYISNDYAESNMIECSETGEYRLEEDMCKIHGSDKFIKSDYNGPNFKYSSYYDEYIPSELIVMVYLNDKKREMDYRIKNDGTYVEIDGYLYDKKNEIK